MPITAGSRFDGVLLTGGGACTSIGRTLTASAAAVRAGIAGFGQHPYVVDTAGQPMIVSHAAYIPDEVSGVRRLLALALPAGEEAITSLRGLATAVAPVRVFVGLPMARPGMSAGLENEFAAELQRDLAGRIPLGAVQAISRGHSAGLMALEAACRVLNAGEADVCLVGGVDSYLQADTLEWLEACGQVHSAGPSNNAWGFVPGEAASFCLLISTRAARKYGVESYGQVRAVTVAREMHLIKTDAVCLGRGLTAAFTGVFDTLPSPRDTVDDVICDMNGESYRAEEFGFATIRTSHRFASESECQTPADCWGDVGAASGPLFVNLAAVAHAKRYAAGPRTLTWTSSESGERAAAIIEF